jgi:hypothetical protein
MGTALPLSVICTRIVRLVSDGVTGSNTAKFLLEASVGFSWQSSTLRVKRVVS